MIQQDPRYQQREYRLSIKTLAIAASHLTEEPRNPPVTVGVTAALIDAGQTYGTHPSIDALYRTHCHGNPVVLGRRRAVQRNEQRHLKLDLKTAIRSA